MKKKKIIKKINDYCSSLGSSCKDCVIKDEKNVQKTGCYFNTLSKKELKKLMLLIKNKKVSQEPEPTVAAQEINKFLLLKSLTTSELKAEIKNRARMAILTGNEEDAEDE